MNRRIFFGRAARTALGAAVAIAAAPAVAEATQAMELYRSGLVPRSTLQAVDDAAHQQNVAQALDAFVATARTLAYDACGIPNEGCAVQVSYLDDGVAFTHLGGLNDDSRVFMAYAHMTYFELPRMIEGFGDWLARQHGVPMMSPHQINWRPSQTVVLPASPVLPVSPAGHQHTFTSIQNYWASHSHV